MSNITEAPEITEKLDIPNTPPRIHLKKKEEAGKLIAYCGYVGTRYLNSIPATCEDCFELRKKELGLA